MNRWIRSMIFTFIFLWSGVFIVTAEVEASVRFDAVHGVIEKIAPEMNTLSVRLADQSLVPVRVDGNTYVHILEGLDGRSRRGSAPEFADCRPGLRIFVSGLMYDGQEKIIAKQLVLFGGRPDDFVFEDPDWWSSLARSLSDFWIDVQFETFYPLDPSGYRTNITKSGEKRNESRNLQETVTLSRLVYGLSSTYMITGDPRLFEAARALVEYQRHTMRYVSADGEEVYWAHAVRNGRRTLGSLFSDDTNTIPLYEQIYCLAGLTQYYRITGDQEVLSDIKKTMNFMEARYWDAVPEDPLHQGFFSHISAETLQLADVDKNNHYKKNWNSIGDHLPAYLSNLYLGTREQSYLDKLSLLGRLIITHFPDEQSPFVFERFYEDYRPDLTYSWQQDRGVVGHNLKIAWCLTRLYHLTGEKSFLSVAQKSADQMAVHGEDLRRGGWYDVIERQANPQNGLYELTWHDRKAWWQQEQGILANYLLWATTGKAVYMDTARRGTAFYLQAFLDRDDGGVYFDVQADGIPYLKGDRTDKGSHSKSGYHSLELAYFGHLYTNLLVRKRPVALHFRPSASSLPRTFQVQPITFPTGSVTISGVEINGQKSESFDPEQWSVDLPASDRPLDMQVTLSPVSK